MYIYPSITNKRLYYVLLIYLLYIFCIQISTRDKEKNHASRFDNKILFNIMVCANVMIIKIPYVADQNCDDVSLDHPSGFEWMNLRPSAIAH